MKKIFTVFLLLLVIRQFPRSQEIIVKGQVINSSNNEMVVAASVGHKDGTMVKTDEKGQFRISVPSLPATLILTSIGFEPLEVIVRDRLVILSMHPNNIVAEEAVTIVWGPNRVPTRVINSATSIERNGPLALRNAPSDYYSRSQFMKGVDITTSSFTFKTISTRGFNGSGSTRVNQIVDGMDNQAPGLNFFVGNFAGLTELDVDNVEILPGASSALYGPGGMNGTILINSKDPFKSPGLSLQLKNGFSHVDGRHRDPSPFHDLSLRYARQFRHRVAFKIGMQYIKAADWLAADSTNYNRTGTIGKRAPGSRQTDPNYDGVNLYGDETTGDMAQVFRQIMQMDPRTVPVLSPFTGSPVPVSRTGYAEKDVVDPETRNIKLSGALHYRFSDRLEGRIAGFWATGNTVYTGNNRYVLKGIKIGQYKVELQHRDGFLRTYTTQENAGEAYSATVTMQRFNEAWKPSFDPGNIQGSWYPQYAGAFATAGGQVFQQAFAAAKARGESDQQAYASAQAAVIAAAPQLHQVARSFADGGRPLPGTAGFKTIFDQVRKKPIPAGGLFLEKSQLWMTEGQYRFSKIRFAEIITGGNIKRYILNSKGTLFIDTLKPIAINEVGGYAQVRKQFFRNLLTLSFSARYDKNEDFKGRFTPRATALIQVAKDNNLRFSYQTAYRFPSTQQKYIRLDVGDYTILGGLPWVMNYMQTKGNPVYELQGNIPGPHPFEYKPLKPELMRSFEFGYKGLIGQKLLIDAYAYQGSYRDFLGRNVLFQPSTGKVYSTVVNSQTQVKTYGFGLGMDYQLPKGFSFFANAYSDRITDVPEGFQPFFNTPEYRFNAGFMNTGLGKKKQLGFNVLYRWQDAFIWDGELANGPVAAFSTVDAQVSYRIPRTSTTLRLGGTNIGNHYYKNGYGNPEIGSVYYLALGYKL